MSEQLIFYVDGLCEPVNPGGVAVSSYLILDVQTGETFAAGSLVTSTAPWANSGFADWRALQLGIQALIEKQWKGTLLRIWCDSANLIHGLNGGAMKNAAQRGQRKRCLALLEKLGVKWTAGKIRKDMNDCCDAMSRETYAAHCAVPQQA